jgi:oleate hydratase
MHTDAKRRAALLGGDTRRAYLVGGSIASLAAAVLLIRDAGMPGANIQIFEELEHSAGAFDAAGDPIEGHVTRGGRMFTEQSYGCLWNILDSIPAAQDPSRSVKEELWASNRLLGPDAPGRLIDGKRQIVDASDLGLEMRDRLELARLLVTPESHLDGKRIEACFSGHFFTTNFWTLWQTTFAFQNWHSAIELKRYLLRFLQELPRIHDLAGVRRSVWNQYDMIVAPMVKWLRGAGVGFESGVAIEDADFILQGRQRRLVALHGRKGAAKLRVDLGAHDIALLTLGSMTADSRAGDDENAPELVRHHADGAWTLWDNLTHKMPDLGSPSVFHGRIDESKWESFTLILRNPQTYARLDAYTGNLPGTGGLITFRDSNWLLSIVIPQVPHFALEPAERFTIWGYGVSIDRPGNFIQKPMSVSSGREILEELLHHLDLADIAEDVLATSTVIPVMMPFITSEFQPRRRSDRPPVIPLGAENFALLGQFVEIPEDVVFTVEYSARGAMHAVYGLLGLDREVPPVHHAIADPQVALDALGKLLS